MVLVNSQCSEKLIVLVVVIGRFGSDILKETKEKASTAGDLMGPGELAVMSQVQQTTITPRAKITDQGAGLSHYLGVLIDLGNVLLIAINI